MSIDFMVAGFRKCGTTSIYEILSQHTQIYVPAVKEIDFFADEIEYTKGYEWYLKRYFGDCPAGMVKGEVNPRLSFLDKTVPRKICENIGKNVKIIFLVRNPVESLYSLFKMRALYGRAFPDEEKERNLQERQNDAFDYFVKQNFLWKDGRYIASQDRTKLRMIDSGRYSSYIKEYFKYFPKEQIKIIVFEECIRNPKLVYFDLFEFLGVKPEPQINYHQWAMKGNRIPINMESMQAYSDISEQYTKNITQYDTADNERDLELRQKYEEAIKSVVKVPNVKYKIGSYAKEVLTLYYAEEKKEMEYLLGKSLKDVWW